MTPKSRRIVSLVMLVGLVSLSAVLWTRIYRDMNKPAVVSRAFVQSPSSPPHLSVPLRPPTTRRVASSRPARNKTNQPYVPIKVTAWASKSEMGNPTGALYLHTEKYEPLPMDVPVLASELYRQGVLIAARDGLGLRTRDESLREWPSEVVSKTSLTFDPGGANPHLAIGESPVVWSDTNRSPTEWYTQVVDQTIHIESLSRDDFVKALQAQGFKGEANVKKPGAPAPDEAENRLCVLDELSQFSVLRDTNALIRKDGESEARLGVLVRAYANLGQLTRFHWSIEHEVYIARSLLYAQRMVAADQSSPVALWHRAYAMALAGLQNQALKDLAAASGLAGQTDLPGWVKLLEPFCRYDSAKLSEIANADDAQRPIATYLAFIVIEHSGCQAATLAIGKAASEANPQCLRVIDAMCNSTGPGLLNQLAEQGPSVFSDTLGSELKKMPGLPDAVKQKIEQVRRPGGNPNGREAVCQMMIEQGSPENDPLEPSLAAVARSIQETTFAHVRRKADLIALQWGVDASDYVAQVQPLIAEHRFKGIIDAYGADHEATPTRVVAALSGLKWSDLTMAELPLYELEFQFRSRGSDTALVLAAIFEQSKDPTSFDKEAWLLRYGYSIESAEPSDSVANLQSLSSDSPWITRDLIIRHWDPAKATQWEESRGGSPLIQFCLAQKYAQLKQWSDAERCFKKYIVLSPDLQGYAALADICKSQGKESQWLSTLKDYLTNTESIGLEHAQVQSMIATYYMDKGRYKEAIPFADAASSTGAAWGLELAVRAHTDADDFVLAEQLVIERMQHYSESPFAWVVWCVQTGHGNRTGAFKAFHDYITSRGQDVSDEDLMQLAMVDVIELNNPAAIEQLKKRFENAPGSFSLNHVIILADEIDDSVSRDDAIEKLAGLRKSRSTTSDFARELAKAYQPGANATLDLKAVDAILRRCKDTDRIEIRLLTARYLKKHDQKDEALRYLKECYIKSDEYCVDNLLVYQTSRDLGLDPLVLTKPSTQPSH